MADQFMPTILLWIDSFVVIGIPQLKLVRLTRNVGYCPEASAYYDGLDTSELTALG